jgi:hypothetical protein
VVVKVADFKASLSGAAPASGLDAPLAALWWAAKGHWDEAHKIVQDEATADAAWVHAYLHRVEGDIGNAGTGRPLSLSRPVRSTSSGKQSRRGCSGVGGNE